MRAHLGKLRDRRLDDRKRDTDRDNVRRMMEAGRYPEHEYGEVPYSLQDFAKEVNGGNYDKHLSR